MGYDGNVSDGYHTFNELYEHRNILFCLLLNCQEEVKGGWSRLHHDGTMFDGYIIAFIETDGGFVSYHMYDDFVKILPAHLEVDRAPEWDGHTSEDSIKRMTNMILELDK